MAHLIHLQQRDVSQLRQLCNRIGVSQVARSKDGLRMKLDERYVPEPAVFLQAIAEMMQGRKLESRISAAAMMRNTPF